MGLKLVVVVAVVLFCRCLRRDDLKDAFKRKFQREPDFLFVFFSFFLSFILFSCFLFLPFLLSVFLPKFFYNNFLKFSFFICVLASIYEGLSVRWSVRWSVSI